MKNLLLTLSLGFGTCPEVGGATWRTPFEELKEIRGDEDEAQ